MEGRVLSGVGGFYTVLTDDGGRFTVEDQVNTLKDLLTCGIGKVQILNLNDGLAHA